jgi:mannose-1-phosphate guanylyltransferase/phosphomannomutase
MKAIIMAGGKGTRLRSVASDIPKPMVSMGGKPILERQIDELKSFGVTDITLVVGYLGEVIQNYFQDGSRFGVKISYIVEKEPMGSGGSLYFLKDQITEDCLLVFGDILFSIDWNRFVAFHKEHKASISLFCHPNSHPFDSDLILTDSQSRVLGIDSKNNIRDYFYHNQVNAGLYVLSPKVFEILDQPIKRDFEKDILSVFIGRQEVYGYCSSEYVKDAGTPDRYASINEDIAQGIVDSKNLRNPQRCIFLDRDGTINKYVGFVTKPEQLELIPGVSEAIKLINKSRYLCIVITNQPVIARGETTFAGLQDIHNKMETLLGREGAYLDGIFFCPHHPDKGFPGEVKELKIDCDCRKPKIGLLIQAQKRFHIDLEKSYFIGDSPVDVQTGMNAHCAGSYQIKDSQELLQTVQGIIQGGISR